LGDPWKCIETPARHFARSIDVHVHQGESRTVEEHIIRFPSAPIYGINRVLEYGVVLDRRPNLHTLRLLRRPGKERVRRLFILHNGLNEADSLRFYYRLADWIFAEHAGGEPEGSAACVIMPFAGHLMHKPFHGPFSQTPLSRYLSDSGELFRQFLRYMVEMRWMLSAVGDPTAEDWRVGWDIVRATRLEKLGKELRDDWVQLADASVARIDPKGERRREEVIGSEVQSRDMRETVAVLRSVLGRTGGNRSTPLTTHVVGYSLGGFLAQSVFFAWPQFVSSCTTICSGGAISALSPTSFAHEEEWQAVLHSLRSELEDAMLSGRLSRASDETVAGMPSHRFGYFKRVFDQVFLQEDQGSYRQRLSEYSARMLFISGGEDPIVKPQNLLDASPPEGINMLSIANLTHFLALDPREDRPQETAQREFWLPEVGRLIARAAMRAEELVADEVRTANELRASDGPAAEKSDGSVALPRASTVKPRRPRGPALSSSEFDTALDWVLDGITGSHKGWLLVSRNTVPSALLAERHFSEWGAALHHHDVRIQSYAEGLRRRAAILGDRRDRFTLLIPEKLSKLFVDSSALFDPQSDTPSGRFMEKKERDALWKDFMARWCGCTREFVSGPVSQELDGVTADDGPGSLVHTLSAWQGVSSSHLVVGHLPDVWISIGSAQQAPSPGRAKNRGQFVDEFMAWVGYLIDELEPGSTELKQAGNDETRDGERLQWQLNEGRVRIVQVSNAEFNPRYRGRIESSRGAATRLLAQCAAAMLRSAPCEASPTEA
jgi:pimeloyl-ACP methyl ester carboxylesterase